MCNAVDRLKRLLASDAARRSSQKQKPTLLSLLATKAMDLFCSDVRINKYWCNAPYKLMHEGLQYYVRVDNIQEIIVISDALRPNDGLCHVKFQS